MIKECHCYVILWGGFGSTKCDPNLTSHLRRFFAGDTVSSSLPLNVGQVQGTVLGLLIFIFYINNCI